MSTFLSKVINNQYDNLLINGDMFYNQRQGDLDAIFGSPSTASGKSVDRYGININAPGVASRSHVASSPTIGESGFASSRAIRFDVTTNHTHTGTEISQLEQRIEGTTLKKLNAINKDLLFVFWTRSDKSYTLSANLRTTADGVGFASGETYAKSFVTAGGQVWKRHAIIIPKPPTIIPHSGVGIGMSAFIILGAGPGRDAVDGVWGFPNANAVAGADNVMDTIGNWIEITQMCIVSADSFNNDIKNNFQFVPHTRMLDGELDACRRYYETNKSPGTRDGTVDSIQQFKNVADFTTSGIPLPPIQFKTKKRIKLGVAPAGMTLRAHDGQEGTGLSGKITLIAGGGPSSVFSPADLVVRENNFLIQLGTPGSFNTGIQFGYGCEAEL